MPQPLDAGADVLAISMAGIEEMYWVFSEFTARGGINVMASLNPIDCNDVKIMKSGSRPLDEALHFKPIKGLAGAGVWRGV